METAKQTNEHEHAVTLARLREATVKADPNSTREDISAAREDRRLAELLAMLNDHELQRVKARYELEAITPTFDPTTAPDKRSQERKYLAVPYGERNAAKAAGAWWDPSARSWYA